MKNLLTRRLEQELHIMFLGTPYGDSVEVIVDNLVREVKKVCPFCWDEWLDGATCTRDD